MSLSEQASQRVVRGHASVVARVSPASLPFVSEQRVHIRRRLLLLEQPPNVRRYPLVPPLLGDVRRHLLLGHDRSNVNVDRVLGLCLGFPPLASGSPTTCPAPASCPTPLRSALAHAPRGSTGPSRSFPRPVPSVHPAFLSMRNPTLSAPIFGAALVGLPRALRGTRLGTLLVPSRRRGWTDTPRRPSAPSPEPPEPPAPAPAPSTDADVAYPVPAASGTMAPPARNTGPGGSMMPREVAVVPRPPTLLYFISRSGAAATTRRRDDATTRDSKRGGFERGERVRR